MPYYNPVTLARRLTTIDVLSNGRLRVGLGLGWSQDEMDATNANMKQRGAMADEFLQVLKAIWTTNPVKYEGKFFRVPQSYISQKPVQKPHPPIYLAAFAPPALKRLATMADGWNPVAIPVAGMTQMFGAVQQMARKQDAILPRWLWSCVRTCTSPTSRWEPIEAFLRERSSRFVKMRKHAPRSGRMNSFTT